MIEKSRKEMKQKRELQKKKDDEEKQKEEDSQYAYTPKQGFDWDNVSMAVNDVI